MHSIIAISKGHIPLNMVMTGVSLATPATTYTLAPTGMVITPIPTTNTIITPNQTGSKPRPTTTGKKIGIEIPKRRGRQVI